MADDMILHQDSHSELIPPKPTKKKPKRTKIQKMERELRKQQAIQMRAVGRMTYRQIADELDVSLTYVRTLLREAFDELSEQNRQEASELIHKENIALDQAQFAVYAMLTDESPDIRMRAVKLMIELVGARASLNGLKAPERSEVLNANVDLTALSPDQLARLASGDDLKSVLMAKKR
jgi:DNA-binding CsgD family transcriptional regulator